MAGAAQILGLIAAAALVAGLSARLGLSSPLVLTGVGLVVSFVPGVPGYELEPELVLLGVLPPLLYATAIRTPFVAISRNRRPIALLSVVLVLVTAAAVALVARAVLGPELSWPAAVALGAVVAPPDAVAATAVGRRIGMPRRVLTLLEGESLLNDATALVTLRSALAALAASVSLLAVAEDFVLAVVLGAGAGWLVAAVVTRLRRHVTDPVLDTTASLLVPYVCYLAAEAGHGSGVLAVVLAGLILGHRAPEIQSAASRVTERTLWRTVQFLLESVVFLLIGLQLRRLVEDASASEVANGRIVLLCIVVVATVVVVRMVWVFPAAYLPRLVPSIAAAEPRPPVRHVALLGWAGMRGVVTLAAAFGLPADTPAREALVVAAFAVVAVTLLVQGAGLPVVVRLFRVAGPDPAQDALQQALVLQRAVDAGRARLEEEARRVEDATGRPASPVVVKSLSRWGEQIAHAVWERLALSDPDAETPSSAFRRLRVAMLDAERGVVVDVHRSGAVPPEVLEAVMERLDAEEAMLTGFADGSVRLSGGYLTEQPARCVHLAEEPDFAVPDDPSGCPDCVALGEREWVALRMCVRCGHVGCCDSSPHRHATAHFLGTQHPVIRSIELDETWRWCYVDAELG